MDLSAGIVENYNLNIWTQAHQDFKFQSSGHPYINLAIQLVRNGKELSRREQLRFTHWIHKPARQPKDGTISYHMNGIITMEVGSYHGNGIIPYHGNGIIPWKWNHTIPWKWDHTKTMESYHTMEMESYQGHGIIPWTWNHTKAMGSYQGHGIIPRPWDHIGTESYHTIQIFSYNIHISKQVYSI